MFFNKNLIKKEINFIINYYMIVADVLYCIRRYCMVISILMSHVIRSNITTRSIRHDKKLTRREWKVDTTGMTMPLLRSLKCQIPALHSVPARKLHERIAFPLSFKPGYRGLPLTCRWPLPFRHRIRPIEYPLLFAVMTSLAPTRWSTNYAYITLHVLWYTYNVYNIHMMYFYNITDINVIT